MSPEQRDRPEQEEQEDAGSAGQEGPLKPAEKIFDEETAEAVKTLQRPARPLLVAGLLAGLVLGNSILVRAVLHSLLGPESSELARTMVSAAAFPVGFIIVIVARTSLFTEFTTMAIFPVLVGKAPVRALLRLWGLVYVSNLVGGALFAWLLTVLGPALGVIHRDAFREISHGLVKHDGWVIFLSALVAGWLMGVLSWLVRAGKDSISHLVLITLITGIIGIGHLHHIVSGVIEVLAGFFAQQGVSLSDLGGFVLWTTLGNIVGGLLFAVSIRYSIDRDRG